MKIKIVCGILWGLVCALSTMAQQRTVAITFDDLPVVGTLDAAEAQKINRAILDSLERHKVPSIGFVVEARVQEIGKVQGRELLDLWMERGHDLGNHTFSHTAADKLSAAEFNEGIIAGEASIAAALAKVGRQPRYFRFPESHTGDSKEKHDEIAEFLKKRGYEIAVCTIEDEDFVFNAAYLLALAKKDEIAAVKLRKDYLAYAGTEIDYYSGLHGQIFGRQTAQVMVLHVNRLNADVIGPLLELFEERQYAFVTLGGALADPAYRTPDVFLPQFAKYGPMWGYRWAAELHVAVNGNLEKEPPAWVLEYGKKVE